MLEAAVAVVIHAENFRPYCLALLVQVLHATPDEMRAIRFYPVSAARPESVRGLTYDAVYIDHAVYGLRVEGAGELIEALRTRCRAAG